MYSWEWTPQKSTFPGFAGTRFEPSRAKTPRISCRLQVLPVSFVCARRQKSVVGAAILTGENRSMATGLRNAWYVTYVSFPNAWLVLFFTHFEITFVTSKQKKVSCYTKICKNGSQSIARIPFWINHQDMLLRGARHVSLSPPHVGRYMTASLVP